MCPVCSAPSNGGLCPACASVTSTHEAIKPPPMLWKRGEVAQVRDRAYIYSHAREVLARDDISIEDLESLRDRMPRSKRGDILRSKFAKRIAELHNPSTSIKLAFDK